jgi:hypothetical protein
MGDVRGINIILFSPPETLFDTSLGHNNHGADENRVTKLPDAPLHRLRGKKKQLPLDPTGGQQCVYLAQKVWFNLHKLLLETETREDAQSAEPGKDSVGWFRHLWSLVIYAG